MRKARIIVVIWYVVSALLKILGVVPSIGYGPGFANVENPIYASDAQILLVIELRCVIAYIVFSFVRYYAKKEGNKIINIIAHVYIAFSAFYMVLGVLDLLGIVPRGIIVA